MPESNPKIGVLNHAARLGVFPVFHHEENKSASVTRRFQITITMESHNIHAVGRGPTPAVAERDACVEYHRQANMRTAERGSQQHKPTKINLDSAEKFVHEYGKSMTPPIRFSVVLSELGPAFQPLGLIWEAQLKANEFPFGEPIMDARKNNASRIAYLYAAIRLGSGQQRNPTGFHLITMPMDGETLDIMEQTIDRIAKLQEQTAPRLALASKGYKYEELQSQRIFRDRMPESIIQQRSDELLLGLKASVSASITESRASLPMYQQRDVILELITKNQYSIIVGRTGSGKTTQVPQILFEDYIKRGEGGRCNIFCTQPRVLAATSVARRVARERGEALTDSVGYHVRFQLETCQTTGSITYCTTGILLKQLQSMKGQIFTALTHIIIDEVHERDVSIDLLLALLKQNISERVANGQVVPKIVLMSATMDVERFGKYFESIDAHGNLCPCPYIDVEGRTFPVRKRYLGDMVKEFEQYNSSETFFLRDEKTEDLQNTEKYLKAETSFVGVQEREAQKMSEAGEDWRHEAATGIATKLPPSPTDSIVPVRLVAFTIAHICKTSQEGAILVFLPGMPSIESIHQLLVYERPLGLEFDAPDKFRIIKLHSELRETNDSAFQEVPQGCRKILLSTNIAETSITIPDVRFVVDSGKHMLKRYDHDTRISSLNCTWVSKSNAEQRAGRAGRVAKGNYYAMFTKDRLLAFDTMIPPEMLRTDLQDVCLRVKVTQAKTTVKEFLAGAIEPPSVEAIDTAINELVALKAFSEDEAVLPLGRLLADIPLRPSLGKMVVLATIFRCLDPIVAIGAQMEGESLFVNPFEKRHEVNLTKREFSKGTNSDIFAVYNAFRQSKLRQGTRHFLSFMAENFIKKQSYLTMEKQMDKIEMVLINARLIPDRRLNQRKDSRVGHPDLNRNSDEIPLINALLVAGFTNENIAVVRKPPASLRTKCHKKVQIHPSSLNDKTKGQSRVGLVKDSLWCFGELSKKNVQGQLFLRDTNPASPLMSLLWSNSVVVDERGFLLVDGWLALKPRLGSGRSFNLDLVVRFRNVVDEVLNNAFEGLLGMNIERGRSLADDTQREVVVEAVTRILQNDTRLNQIYDPES